MLVTAGVCWKDRRQDRILNGSQQRQQNVDFKSAHNFNKTDLSPHVSLCLTQISNILLKLSLVQRPSKATRVSKL
jgi:hypothetical protein